MNNRIVKAIRSAVPYTPEAIAEAIPNDWAKIDGRFVMVARIPHIKLSDQFGNSYEGLVIVPEIDL